MGNILIDMMGLLNRKRVVKNTEDTDYLVLGRRPNPDDSMFNTPKMYNELISIKDLKAGINSGEVTGSGTTNYIPVYTDGANSVIGDSQLRQSNPNSAGLYQMRMENTDRFIINKPSSITSGDPEYLITQDGNYKVSFGWDDDGGGFGYLYNWSGAGLKLGSAGNNPMLEIKTTFGLEEIDLHKSIKFVDYGSGTYTGTVAYTLAVDNAGNVIETTDGGGTVTGIGTTNTLPIWSDGPNGELSDSQVTQTKIDGGTVFDLNAVTTTAHTPAINTKLLDLNSGGTQKFSITQDGGGGVILPSGGGVTNPGPSFNMGGGAFSNGKSGVAMGSTTTAFGNGSLAANFLTLASGGGASAFGLLTEAGGLASASFGNKTKASGLYTIASGQDSIASGQSAVAIGEKGDAQGKNSFVSGFGGTATANNAVKFGYEGTASGSNSAKFGFESVASGPNSFAIGDGTTASGFQSIASGDNNVVSGDNSFIGGKNSTVTGSESIAYGVNNTISANFCTIFGTQNTIPSGGFQSFIAGDQNNAGTLGKQQLIGVGLTGQNLSQGGVYLGRYNDSTDPYGNFQIGNGTTNANRVNALSINYQGRVKLPTYGSGSVTGTVTYNLAVDADGKIIETPKAFAPGYLSTVFLVSQASASAPVNQNLIENSLGIPLPFNWTYVSPGVYNLNAPGKFKPLKTVVFANNGNQTVLTDPITWTVVDTDNIIIRTGNTNNQLIKASIEIRTYN